MDQLPVSPLKPRMLATLEPVTGLKLATGNSGTRYKGRDDVTLGVFPGGNHGRGRVHEVSHAPARPWTGRRTGGDPGRRHRSRAAGQRRQRQRLHRGARLALQACQATAQAVAKAVGWLRAARRFALFDRRDRRTAGGGRHRPPAATVLSGAGG